MEILLIAFSNTLLFFCSWRWSYPTQMQSCDYLRSFTTKFTRSDLGASFLTLQSVFDSYKAHFNHLYEICDWPVHIFPINEKIENVIDQYSLLFIVEDGWEIGLFLVAF